MVDGENGAADAREVGPAAYVEVETEAGEGTPRSEDHGCVDEFGHGSHRMGWRADPASGRGPGGRADPTATA